MNRRAFLATVSAVPFGGCTAIGDSKTDGQQNHTPTNESDGPVVDDPPEEVAAVQPLAEAFHTHITEFYPDARVFITPSGEIVMDYQGDASSGDALKREYNNIATEYAEVIETEGTEPTTLIISPSNVKVYVVESALRAYVNDEIDEKAFLETIELKTSEQRDPTAGE
ncbi:hypothetical protein [Natrinema altunense]|uniref:hypothetical protein n=1 Tax=Natrinema altunense TaxID=222984 RepID=UPI001EFA0470|nr:hypothetical protein [Natrinema altunense]